MISPFEKSKAARSYLERIDVQFKSIYTASKVIVENQYERDVIVVKFNRRGFVSATKGYNPTEEEIKAIAEEAEGLDFPEQVMLGALPSSELPPLIKEAKTEDLYIFKNSEKQIRFIQVRIELPNGDKKYVPQTYWSDGVWRAAEPEEGLPLYNAELLYKGARVFIHEGAKAARAAQDIADNGGHPWSSYYSTGVHVGWIGGVYHLHRNLWGELRGIPGEAIIVPDNDFVGKFRIKQIAKKFQCATYYARFDARWPKSWDSADPLPENMFSSDGQYQGPEFEELLQSCSRATEVVGVEGNKTIYGIREAFAENWVRIQNLRHYADINNPEFTMDKEQFNVMVRPYSDVADTASLLSTASGNICDKVTFMPDHPSGLITVEGDYCLNQYVDRRMKPLALNDTSPFWDFMEYLLPDERERTEIIRWMATLYAQPETRIGYGILLLSKMQGVGKSTLLDIIASLIGKRHVSFPGDAMVQSDFNGWVVNKRLVVVHEIYAGQNWKTYNRLKSLMTDEFVEANNKHMVNYTLPNWSHYAAASNSMEALRVENDDRRWLIPKLPNYLYKNYGSLYAFIAAGGLRAIANEFLNRDDYIKAGEHAPLTDSKKALIDQSMPPDERLVVILMERLPEGSCMDIKDIWLWVQEEAKSRAFITPQRIKSLLLEKGYCVDEPATIGSRERILAWSNEESRAYALKDAAASDLAKIKSSRLSEPSHVFKDDSSM
jgi:hypothetical protein